MLDALPDATAVIDSAGVIIAVNRAWRMFALDNGGIPENTGVGVNYLQVCARSAASGNADALAILAGLRSVLAGETVEHDREYPCPAPGVQRWFISRITGLGLPQGGAVTSHVNISGRKRAEDELAHQAAHDPLTGLANRRLFLDRLTSALTHRQGRATGGSIGVLYVDLDGFKSINDLYGHAAGDELLAVTADRLRTVVRPQDTVARLGGDEFAICIPGRPRRVDRLCRPASRCADGASSHPRRAGDGRRQHRHAPRRCRG